MQTLNTEHWTLRHPDPHRDSRDSSRAAPPPPTSPIPPAPSHVVCSITHFFFFSPRPYFPTSSPFTRQPCASSILSFCTPFYFNLSSPNLTLSHSLYKYLSLSLPLPPSPAHFWREQGECSIPCGSEHPLKVRSAAAAGANRPGFRLSFVRSVALIAWAVKHTAYLYAETLKLDWTAWSAIQRISISALCLI